MERARRVRTWATRAEWTRRSYPRNPFISNDSVSCLCAQCALQRENYSTWSDWRRWTLSSEEPEDKLGGEEKAPTKPAKATVTETDEREAKIAELTDDLKRLQADFENFKKRTEREWGERSRLATQRLMSDLLPVLDTFDKAIEETRKAGDDDCLKEGLVKVHRQLMQALEGEGLKVIRTEGKFDPFLHEAIQREERPDAEEGRILEVYQRGYTLNGKTLRPSRVKVSHKAEKKEPEESKPEEADQSTQDQKDQYSVK